MREGLLGRKKMIEPDDLEGIVWFVQFVSQTVSSIDPILIRLPSNLIDQIEPKSLLTGNRTD